MNLKQIFVSLFVVVLALATQAQENAKFKVGDWVRANVPVGNGIVTTVPYQICRLDPNGKYLVQAKHDSCDKSIFKVVYDVTGLLNPVNDIFKLDPKNRDYVWVDESALSESKVYHRWVFGLEKRKGLKETPRLFALIDRALIEMSYSYVDDNGQDMFAGVAEILTDHTEIRYQSNQYFHFTRDELLFEVPELGGFKKNDSCVFTRNGENMVKGVPYQVYALFTDSIENVVKPTIGEPKPDAEPTALLRVDYTSIFRNLDWHRTFFVKLSELGACERLKK